MGDDHAIVNHTGVCVSDVDRSIRFYAEVFGFERWRDNRAPDDLTTKLFGLPAPLQTHTVYLRLGSYVLELLSYDATRPHRPLSQRQMDELGMTHLSISVPDIPLTCKRVVEFGGSVEHASNIELAVMVRDPDGQLIELVTLGYARRVAGL
jgi:catechol 2,3-dioxygenase-like lactoylglutathione lyase family enzyme